MKDDRELVTALARGLHILASFTARATTLSSSELSERTGLPKATVSRLTYTLVELGYLHRSSSKRKYALSAAVLALGYPLLASLTIRQVAQPMMRELSAETGGTVSLGVLDRDRVVYIETCRSAPNVDHLPDIGVIWPLMESAIGRALLAGLDVEHRAQLLNTIKVLEPERYTNTIAGVEEALRDYEKFGYCVALGELRRGIYGVAVPVKRSWGEHRLAFNCGVPGTDPKGEALRRDVAPKLIRLVRSVEDALDALNSLEDPIHPRRTISGMGNQQAAGG
ncbi:MAG: IclR family transcriptional regulator [Rhodoferax sp.]|nr:IclR family transcriptional regulator [Rhodoferax sp.]